MPGLLMSMNEVAEALGGCDSTCPKARHHKAKRFLQRLEQKYGVTLLIKLGGQVRTGRWYCPRAKLMAILEPGGEEHLQATMLHKGIEDLKMRVEALERKQISPNTTV